MRSLSLKKPHFGDTKDCDMLENSQISTVLTKQESVEHDCNQQATAFARGFVSGMFVGEGTLGLQKHTQKGMKHLKYTPRIRISNTEYRIIQETMRCLKVLEIPFFVEQCDRDTTAWNICIVGWQRIAKFSKALLRDIVGKKADQLRFVDDLYIEKNNRGYHDDCTQKEKALFEKIRNLNKKGRGVLRD